MCPKGGKTTPMESVRLKIHEHMTSVVGEDILCVLDKRQQQSDAVRLFVMERLSVAAGWICSLVQREMELQGTLLEKRNKIPDSDVDLDIDLPTADIVPLPVCREEVFTGQPERSSSLVQEEPQPPYIKEEQEEMSPGVVRVKVESPQIKEEQEELFQRPEEAGGSSLTLPAVKSEDKNGKTEPVAGTSTEHMKTQAYIKYWVPSQPASTEQLLSSYCPESDITEDVDDCLSRCSEADTEESEDCEEISERTTCAEGQRLPQSDEVPQDRKSKQTHSTRTRTSKKLFSCTDCGKCFHKNALLIRHTRSHTGEKPFACNVCDKCYAHSGDLKRHMRSHTGEKPFSCAVCGKGFGRSDDLKTHMMTHTGEKPFTCNVCGKGFSKIGNAERHMRTHNREAIDT